MLAPGSLLQNRYRVVRLCDRTAVSSCYEAIDQRFGSTVNLKVWSPEAGDVSRKAFERETRLMNSLFHPLLAHVFDSFADGQSLVSVGEYVPGEFLGSVLGIRRDPFDVNEVLIWADRLLDLLGFLHTRSPAIVHGNLHPGSLKITPHGDLVVVDMGLCVELPGTAIGYTLPYAPFEQIQGQQVDERSDLYALGALLFHLLTKTPPPNAFERMAGWANGAPVLLPHVDSINEKVPAAVARIIYSAMGLDREERQAHAADMRAELQGAISSQAPTTETLAPEPFLELGSEMPTEHFPDVEILEAYADTDRIFPEVPPPDSRAVAQDQLKTAQPFPALVPATASARGESTADAPTERRLVEPRRMTKIICRTCNAANEAERVFCPYCGSLLRPADPDLPNTERVQAPVIKCPTCGAGNAAGLTSCRMCAAPLVADQRMPGRGVSTNKSPAVRDTGMDGTVPLRPELLSVPLVRAVAGKQAAQAFIYDGVLAASLAVPKPAASLRVLDGEDIGRELNLRSNEMVVGRSEGDYTFPMDIFMSGRHARLIQRNNRFFLIDNNSRNGTFVRIHGVADLHDGDLFLVGKQQFRLVTNGFASAPKLIEILYSGTEGQAFTVDLPETVIGRSVGAIQFPDDPAMADAHSRLKFVSDHFVIEDLGSKNGTYLRISNETELFDGDVVIMGRHIFLFEIDRNPIQGG